MILPSVRVGAATVIGLGGSEGFNKPGLDGALYSPTRRDCLIGVWNIFNDQNSILLQAAH